MFQRWLMGALVASMAIMGFMLLSQARELDRLEAELETVRAALEAPPAPVLSGSRQPPRPASIPSTPMAAAPRPTPAAPSVSVTRDDLERVEGALLELLDGDHPALRERLRSVVQEQQQTLRDEQHEARRERWVTRREARLLELSQTTGITAEQRATILSIQLANRDQIEELRRSAHSVEEVSTLKDRVQGLREQADAQIRAQLSAEQYAAYQSQFDGD